MAAAANQVAPPTEADPLSLGERAYHQLRAAIVEGALAPGARVSERRLATALGISAQPVREALWRLEQDGMVVTLPRRGTVVAALGPRHLGELGRIRAALEGVAAALAAERLTAPALATLGETVRTMRRATAAADTEALAEANERFHALLRTAAGNVFLVRSLEALRAYDPLGRPRDQGGDQGTRLLGSTPRDLPRALREHVGILAAVRQRDPALAEARMRAHVLRSLATNGLLAPQRAPRRGG